MPGLFLDPAETCGDCLTQAKIYQEYYPLWADVHDVSLAELDGLSRLFEEENSYKVCPY